MGKDERKRSEMDQLALIPGIHLETAREFRQALRVAMRDEIAERTQTLRVRLAKTEADLAIVCRSLREAFDILEARKIRLAHIELPAAAKAKGARHDARKA